MTSGPNKRHNDISGHPIFIGRETTRFEAQPQPPYMIYAQNFFYIGVRYRRDAARNALPSKFRSLDDASGVIGIYTAPEGWGLAPLRGTFFGISVTEPVAPDGSPTVFFAEQILDGPGYKILRESYNLRVRPGITETRLKGSVASGEMHSESGLEITIEGTPRFDKTFAPTSGLHYYLGDAPDGETNIFSVAFTARFTPIDLTAFELGLAASPRLLSLNPVEVTWAMFVDNAPLTFSAPSRFNDDSYANFSARAQQIGIMDILARIGHAAALVDTNGRTLFLTPEARSLFNKVHIGKRLSLWRKSDQIALNNAVSSVRQSQGLITKAIAIELPDRNLPIVVRAMPISKAIAGEPAILFLFSDPMNRSAPTSETMLQLIGLTPAEARLSAQVGSGKSVRESAELIGITESTARSTLKIVYDKLCISRQSELAGVVARLS